jgi:hypothetical protein
MTTVHAEVQGTDPPRVLVTIAGTTAARLTLFRDAGGVRSVVRGALDQVPSAGSLLIFDNEAPFGVDLVYTVRETGAGGGTTDIVSNTIRLDASAPWLTNPITGDGVHVTIQDWPELAYGSRMSVLDVAGRVAPVVVSDLRTAPTSTLVVITQTQTQLAALRHLLAPGDIILLRAICDAVEGSYLAVGDVTEARWRPNSLAGDPFPAGSDWRRLVTLSCTAVDQPSPALPAVGDTLGDLAAFVPTTLGDIAATWPSPPDTLLTIAQAGIHAALAGG